jgi:hypothetical protein
MPFQTKNDRISRPHFEALILGNLEPLKIKTSFWGFDPCLWYVSSPHCEDLILTKSPFSTPHFEALISAYHNSRKSRPHFEVLIQPKRQMSLWSRPYRVLILITRWAISKERKVAPKRAQIRPDLLHPHGYPPRASKRHTRRSWGHTRELADILSVRYVGESVPGKYPLT